MEKNLSPLQNATNDLRDFLAAREKFGSDSLKKKEQLLIALTRDALAGHLGQHWPPQTPSGIELVNFADRVIALVPTLAELKAGRQ